MVKPHCSNLLQLQQLTEESEFLGFDSNYGTEPKYGRAGWGNWTPGASGHIYA